jgi:chaperone required for assembly of F1-ATPase
MNGTRRKRFYNQVEVTGERPFQIALDGKRLRTPLKRELKIQSRGLAEAIAAEWAAQGERIDPRRMWLTKLAITAVDHVEGDEPRIVRELVEYAGSDLVLYRASEPESLVIRQGEYWDPIIAWAEEKLGVRFFTVEGIVHKPQQDEAMTAVARRLAQFDAMHLCALHNITTLTGSLQLALAIESPWLEPERAWLAAHVDEDWQIERWGKDEEAAERRAARKQEFDSAVKFLTLLAPHRSSPV